MTHGGTRPGAGRKKGAPNLASREAQEMAQQGGEMPIDYMLRVMRDESADPDRRDDMAKTAAPYLHGKIASQAPGGDADSALVGLLTGMRQSLATKLDRIARAAATPGVEDADE